MTQTFALLFFPLLMALAASSDLLTMRISNLLVGILAAGFVFLAVALGFPLAQIGMHFAAALVVLIAAFSFFAFGWIGGGDAKLAAATALWLGFDLLPAYLIYGALLGGGLTLMILLARRMPLPAALARIGWIDHLHDQKTGIPYGMALAVAGLIVYSSTPVFLHVQALIANGLPLISS